MSVSFDFGRRAITMGLRTNISSLDHAHVVPAISDAADTLLGELPDKPRDVRLLRRGAPTRNDGGELGRDLNKLVLEQREAELAKRERERDKHVIN
jgi:hypothetical protein